MAEARRILKPTGSVIINISPHIKNGNLSDYVLRTRLALRDDGWIEPDELVWHKTDAMPPGRETSPAAPGSTCYGSQRLGGTTRMHWREEARPCGNTRARGPALPAGTGGRTEQPDH